MLLRPVAWLPFAPVILFSMISMTAWTISPAMGERNWVRMGITLGVPLSLQFLLLLLLIFHAPMLFTTLLVWTGWQTGMALLHFVIRRQFSIWHILVLMTLTALLAFVGVQYFGQSDIPGKIELVQKLAYYIPAAGAFAMLVAAPGLNFVAYSIAAHSIPWPNPDSPPDELLKQKRWRLGWIVYGVCAWRWAIVKSLEEYSSLSYTVSNCYLSNAASHAHPMLTGAARRGAVTMGMRRLKFLEIVLKAIMPKVHYRVRRSYDAWCPPLARYCQSNLCFATLTYLLLLPLEMWAEVLRICLSIHRGQVQAIYGAAEDTTRLGIEKR